MVHLYEREVSSDYYPEIRIGAKGYGSPVGER